MLPSVQHFLSERFSSDVATKVHHRQMLVISGAEIWCLNQLEQLINGIINCQHQPARGMIPDILTCNADLPGSVHASHNGTTASTNNVQFRQHLGREYDLVIYNAWRGSRASALAALSGTIKKNGLLILLCPELNNWPEFRDEELEKRISWGSIANITSSQFIQHLVNAIKADHDLLLLNEGGFCGANQPVSERQLVATQAVKQQRDIIEQIKRVATGHRKRPLIITAERGRGKSAALGIAIAELMTESTEVPPRKILVTAPQKSSLETLFRHALTLSPDISDHLQFCAVDDLLLNLPNADMLVVDEAAAIPVAQLQALCVHYHRMVFSTTTNGYEGSGRGFEVRFKPWLSKNRPEAKFTSLTLPFRWYPKDCLEAFWWKTLHLKPQQAETVLSGRNLSVIANTPPKSEEQSGAELIFREITKVELLADQVLLNSVFSLLVDAHYQTTPDDFVALLDAPEQRLFILFTNQPTPENIGGVLTGSIEGAISDEKLALGIVSGQRRLQGHMLPQQLAYGTGQKPLLQHRYFRVIRIAVRSALRNRRFGSALLKHSIQWCSQHNIQLLGSSFGASADLLKFWLSADFAPALLGFHRDKATAEFNVTVVKQLGENSELAAQLDVIKGDLEDLLHCHMADMWKSLDNQILVKLLLGAQTESEHVAAISTRDGYLLSLFCKGNRSLELSCAAIKRLVLGNLSLLESDIENYSVLVDYSLKKLSNTELVKRHKLEGKKHLLAELKKQTQMLMDA